MIEELTQRSETNTTMIKELKEIKTDKFYRSGMCKPLNL